ncbi:MAG: helix-turn-helix transcriptional regulator, partial [candidate division Zixibacteria bacterium]
MYHFDLNLHPMVDTALPLAESSSSLMEMLGLDMIDDCLMDSWEDEMPVANVGDIDTEGDWRFMDLGDRMHGLRVQAGVTLKAMTELIHCSSSTLNWWERAIKPPTMKHIQRYAKGLQLNTALIEELQTLRRIGRVKTKTDQPELLTDCPNCDNTFVKDDLHGDSECSECRVAPRAIRRDKADRAARQRSWDRGFQGCNGRIVQVDDDRPAPTEWLAGKDLRR